MSLKTWFRAIAALSVACSVAATAADIHIGGLCDRNGPTQNIGGELCPGAADYFALVNRMGGVEGHKLVYTELDHAYQPNRAVQGYGQLKKQGIVALLSYGVPTLYALMPHLMADKIPAFSTGTGPSRAIDGKAWPYIFPGTASYWSQAGAAMKFLTDSGVKKGARIAFLYLDNTAGQEAIPVVEAVARKEGYVLRRFAVPTPGFEMEPQVLDLTRNFKADWVITSLFSGSPTVSIRELRKAGFPLNRVIAFVYGTGDNDVAEAGWDNAQGYLGLQYASVGRDFPVIQDLIQIFRDERNDGILRGIWQRTADVRQLTGQS